MSDRAHASKQASTSPTHTRSWAYKETSSDFWREFCRQTANNVCWFDWSWEVSMWSRLFLGNPVDFQAWTLVLRESFGVGRFHYIMVFECCIGGRPLLLLLTFEDFIRPYFRISEISVLGHGFCFLSGGSLLVKKNNGRITGSTSCLKS